MRLAQMVGGITLLIGSTVTAVAQLPPQDTVINVPEVEVRSGPSLKFYPTGKLRQGDRVQVVKDEGEFLAIVPPPGSFSWINARFVDHKTGSPIGIILPDSAQVMVGSSEVKTKPEVTQVKLERGAQVVILGNSPKTYQTDEEGVWLPIEPPKGREVRYIPRTAVKGNAPIEVVANRQPTTASGAAPASWSAPAGATAGPTDPLWAQAQQAEQAGDIVRAKQYYQALAHSTQDHNLAILCYNRCRFLDEGNRGSVPPGYQPGRPSVAAYGPEARLSGTAVAPAPGGQATSQYCYVKENAPAPSQPTTMTTSRLPAPAPPPPPPAAPAAQQSGSGPGRLYKAGFFVDGKQAYVLETSQGRPRLYVTGTAGMSLEPYVNRVVELYGPMVYRGDLRTNYMTATQVTPLQ
jgi:hypothetical protein